MAFDIVPIIDTIAESILAWCGVDDPTQAQRSVAVMASEAARDVIRHYRGQAKTDAIEDEYETLAIEMGVYLYEKRGVDGTTAFTENGVTRSFEAGSIPASMVSKITPKTVTG